ncbi:MAG: hypothetical protein INR65_06770 [Gluconacetobacter diazotrophicus]|nr:hypothetical protein [Gluconacetobacter diazotrophicus]
MLMLLGVLAAPVLAVSVPPLLDYPNHLARMVVLAENGRDPVLARMYRPHWGVIPNLGTDGIGVALLRVLPVWVAGRLLLILVLLAPVAGMLFYHRALFGQRRWWPLAGGLVACNALFLLGFMNFILSLGAALLVAAGWCRWREERPVGAVAFGAAGATAVFFCHLGGVIFLAVLLGAQEAERLLPLLRHRRWRAAGTGSVRRGMALAVVLAVPAALYGHTGMSGERGPAVWRKPAEKLLLLLDPLLNYSIVLDGISAAVLGGLLLWCRRRGWLAVPPRTVIGLLGLLGLYAVMPDKLKGGAWWDVRFPAMAGYLLFAGTDLRDMPRRAAGVAAAVLVLLFGTREAVLAAVWHGRERDVASVRRVIAPVPAGARVLVLRALRKPNPEYWRHDAPASRGIEHVGPTEFHLAALLLIERRAFWPLLFAIPSQQPLLVRTPYRAISEPGEAPPDFHAIERAPTATELREAPYLRDWWERFDYVLVLDADAIRDPASYVPDRLRLVADDGFAALWAVKGAAGG